MHRGSDGILRHCLHIFEVLVRLPVAEIFLDSGHERIRVEIAGNANRHVIRHVIIVPVILDVDYGRVLQMLLRPQSRLLAVRVVLEENGVDGLQALAQILCQAHVLLLVDRLQLSVESANHRMHESVSLDFRPIVYLIRRNVLGVDSHVVGSEGVCPLSAYD